MGEKEFVEYAERENRDSEARTRSNGDSVQKAYKEFKKAI